MTKRVIGFEYDDMSINLPKNPNTGINPLEQIKTVGNGRPFTPGFADPNTCEHEWWENTNVEYSTEPPSFRQQCSKCGRIRYRSAETEVLPRWVKVIE